MALAAAVDVSDADKATHQATVDVAGKAVMTAQSALDHTAQMMALTHAVTTLQAIDLSGLTTEAKIDAAEEAIAMLRTALDDATELSDAEKSAAMVELATANRTVLMAQGRVDIDDQTMVLADAVKALSAIALDVLLTQTQIDDANAAIIVLELALEATTDLTNAQKLDATVDVTLAKRKVTTAETVLATNIGNQRMALTDTGTVLGEIDLDDLDTPEKVADAKEADDMLKMALAAATHVSDTAKAMYQTQLDTATHTVRMAQNGMDEGERMMTQRTAITGASTMAQTAVAGMNDDSTDSEVAAADAAVKAVNDAIAAAEDLPEDDAAIISAKAVLGVIESTLAGKKTSRMTAVDDQAVEDRKATAKTGKAMHKALGPNDDGETPLTSIATPTLAPTGLTITINAATGAGALATADGDPDDVILKAGDSAGALGSWNGMNYAHTDTGTKVMNAAVVYTNKGPGKTVSFADAEHLIIPDHWPNKGYVLRGSEPTFPRSYVMATAFTHSGDGGSPDTRRE